MEQPLEYLQEPISLKPFAYYIRLIIQLSLNTFVFSLYYHNIPLLVNEDDELSNATDFFQLFNSDSVLRRPIQNCFYYAIPISSLLMLWVSDLLGRKQVLQYSIKWNSVFLLLSFVSLSPNILILANLCMGLNFSSGLVQAYFLLTESLRPKYKDLLTAILFATWGFSMFVAHLACFLMIGWKLLVFFMIFLNFYNFRMISKLVESPEYFKNAGNSLKAEENHGKILENRSENGDWEVAERLKTYEGLSRYFKDFGRDKRFLVVLWVNSVLVYNSLNAADVKITENLYENGMILAFFLTSVLGLAYFQKIVGFWRMFFGAVLLTRLSLIFLGLVTENSLAQKFFYIVAEMTLTYEVFCLFALTDEVLRGRVKGKIFGFLICCCLTFGFLLKKLLFGDGEAKPKFFLTVLATSTSIIVLYYLKQSKSKSEPLKGFSKNSLFELKPLN